MEKREFFKKTLSDVSFDAASGDAIRHLADRGLSPEEIFGLLSYPAPLGKIGEVMLRHFYDLGIVCNDPHEEKKPAADYVKTTDQYGRISFVRVEKPVEQPAREYVLIDFGKRKYLEGEKFYNAAEALRPSDRSYVLDINWPPAPLYHIKNERIERIINVLSQNQDKTQGGK